MQSDCENTGVLKDFPFVAVVGVVYHFSSRGLKKTHKSCCPRRPKTSPKRSSMSYASWKRFWDGFGTILESHMALQKRSLRRPRGHQKRVRSHLASRDASRMDFGGNVDPFGLVFETFWEVILV